MPDVMDEVMDDWSLSPIEGATITVRGEASLRADPDEALLWITLSEVENPSGKALADVGRIEVTAAIDATFELRPG